MFAKSTFFAMALATGSAMAQLMIQTPASLIECQPALLSWSGGSAPYYLAAIPGGQPSAAALKDFGMQSGMSLTWNVDLAAGTSITLKVTDSTGATQYNQAVTIQPGSSTSCVGAAAVSPSGSIAMSSMAASASSAAAMSSASMMSMSSMSAASMSASMASASMSMSMSSASASGVVGAAAVSGTSKAASMSMSMSGTASGTRAAATSGMSSMAASASASGSSSAGFPTVKIGSGIVALALGVMGLAWI